MTCHTGSNIVHSLYKLFAIEKRQSSTSRQKGRCAFNPRSFERIPLDRTNLHHRLPKSLGGGGGSNLQRTQARLHACHHAIASNYPPLEAATCYLIVHYMLYGWSGRILVKGPGEYEYSCLTDANFDLVPSKATIVHNASLIMFGEQPKPRQVIKELETIWLPRGTKVRYLH